jgi:type IV pilus assembly protein PilB
MTLSGALAMKQFELDLPELDDAQEAPVRRLVKVVLLIAIRDRAAQVRFQQGDRFFQMFERVNGVFLEMVPPPRHLGSRIINLLRVIAHLDYASAPRPQRGFGHVRLADYFIHLFVDLGPGSFGNTAVVSMLYSPEVPAQAEQVLALYERADEQDVDAILSEFDELEEEDYFLRS